MFGHTLRMLASLLIEHLLVLTTPCIMPPPPLTPLLPNDLPGPGGLHPGRLVREGRPGHSADRKRKNCSLCFADTAGPGTRALRDIRSCSHTHKVRHKHIKSRDPPNNNVPLSFVVLPSMRNQRSRIQLTCISKPLRRELAYQIADQFRALGAGMSLKVMTDDAQKAFPCDAPTIHPTSALPVAVPKEQTLITSCALLLNGTGMRRCRRHGDSAAVQGAHEAPARRDCHAREAQGALSAYSARAPLMVPLVLRHLPMYIGCSADGSLRLLRTNLEAMPCYASRRP